MPSKSSHTRNVTDASSSGAIGGLGEREREILRDVISMYILSGEPVSSRAVSKHSGLRLSAATIRNVMADLEEIGLLTHPHTSAGRVPTQAGYRFYIESLMDKHPLSDVERRYIDEHLGGANAERVMKAATHLLSDLSHQVGVVLMPTAEETILKAVDFVPLGGRRVLCVLVSATGFVDHIVVETEESMGREDLVRISNYLTDHFGGYRLRRIPERLLEMMAEERAHFDHWFARALDLAQRAVDSSREPSLLVEGTSSLLDRPELSTAETIRRMLDTFADKARLVGILHQCITGDGVRVFLGEDSDVTSELEFSVVATSYGMGDRRLGSLGIIGPSRMEYPRIIPLVRYLANTLSQTLEAGSRE